ncbi:MAG: hypothetical protein KBF64_02400 [Anaerolineaceae bacterium]|nr:hypothetical protein [Anaerolineaceae bacterium]
MGTIEITPLYLVLAGVIGLLIGLLIANIFSGRESRSQKVDQLPKDLQKEGFVEAVSLWYSPAGKRIVTQMDGAFYHTTDTLTTDQKTRVLKILSLWQEWTQQGQRSQTAAQGPTQPVVEAAPFTYIPPQAVQSEEQQTASVQPFKTQPDEPELISELQNSFDIEEEPAPEPVKKVLSITEQISEILEEMLEGTPLKEKGIRLIENPQSGVDVWIGLDKYSGIDAVPDPAVKEMIRRAVIRWEERNDTLRRLQE